MSKYGDMIDDDRWKVTMENYTECRECHMPLASGYLCDHCDDVEVLES